jgi:hypothetical protein
MGVTADWEGKSPQHGVQQIGFFVAPVAPSMTTNCVDYQFIINWQHQLHP